MSSHPAFPVAVSIPGLLDAIGLFEDEELVGIFFFFFFAPAYFSPSS